MLLSVEQLILTRKIKWIKSNFLTIAIIALWFVQFLCILEIQRLLFQKNDTWHSNKTSFIRTKKYTLMFQILVWDEVDLSRLSTAEIPSLIEQSNRDSVSAQIMRSARSDIRKLYLSFIYKTDILICFVYSLMKVEINRKLRRTVFHLCQEF